MAEAASVFVAGVSTAITSGFVLHRWLRPKFSIKVNCWFCNQSTRVPFGNKNCWDCPHCDQYNGFREDGDYNKPIPAQHEEFFNQTPYACRKNSTSVPFTNGFCDECNRNQQLKITAIANFVPLEEDKFEDEANDYRQYLQRVYRLCRRCEAVLRQTLGQQDSYLRPQLLSWRIQRSSSQSSTKSSIMNNAFIRKIHPPRYLTLLRIISLFFLILTTVYEYFHTNDILKLINGFIPVYITNHDIFNSVDLTNFNFRLDSLISLLIGIFVFTICVLCDKFSFRAVDAVVLTSLFLTLPLYSSLPLIYVKNYENYLQVTRRVLCVMNLIFCSWAAICSRTPQRYQPNRKPSPSFVRSKDISTNAWIQNNFSPNSQLQNNRTRNTARPTEILHNSLGAMSIGTPRKLQKTAGIFTLQDYSSPMPGFLSQKSFHSEPNDLRLRRPILMPAKFQSPRIQSKHVWEVNDYWNQLKPRNTSSVWNHGNRNLVNFSSVYDHNLSTASNGFFSPSCPASRSGSVCGDDRASVFSEPPFRFSHNHQPQDDHLPSSTYDNSTSIHNNGDKRGENGSEGTNSSRSSSSVCPVGTTTLNVTESDSCMHFWQKIFLTFSVAVNLILIAVSSRSYLGF